MDQPKKWQWQWLQSVQYFRPEPLKVFPQVHCLDGKVFDAKPGLNMDWMQQLQISWKRPPKSGDVKKRDCFAHTLDMPKPVITFVFKVLRKGLLRYILCTCPNLC